MTKLETEKGASRDEKGYKFEISNIADNKQDRLNNDISAKEKGYKSITENRLSQDEKLTKLLNKKLKYLINILLMLGSSLSIDELMTLFDYRHKGKFRDNYIKPLESVGFIKKTNPEKPTASNQKYLITEKGKRFLTGKDDWICRSNNLHYTRRQRIIALNEDGVPPNSRK